MGDIGTSDDLTAARAAVGPEVTAAVTVLPRGSLRHLVKDPRHPEASPGVTVWRLAVGPDRAWLLPTTGSAEPADSFEQGAFEVIVSRRLKAIELVISREGHEPLALESPRSLLGSGRFALPAALRLLELSKGAQP